MAKRSSAKSYRQKTNPGATPGQESVDKKTKNYFKLISLESKTLNAFSL